MTKQEAGKFSTFPRHIILLILVFLKKEKEEIL